MLPLLGWFVLTILVFNIAFVAFRLWVGRERPAAVIGPRPAFPTAYATILAKEYPQPSRRTHPPATPHH